jgi:Ca2+-binding EF-hand superfamily protein
MQTHSCVQVTGKVYLSFEACVCATKEKPLKSSGRITQKEYNMGFDILDKDHSGFLTRSEVGLESKRLFHVLDQDGDGKISRKEYEAGLSLPDEDFTKIAKL